MNLEPRSPGPDDDTDQAAKGFNPLAKGLGVASFRVVTLLPPLGNASPLFSLFFQLPHALGDAPPMA